MIAAPVLLDPFEHEITLSPEPRVLAFSGRAFEIPPADLLRHLAFDLVGAVPRPVGKVEETFGAEPARTRFRSSFFQVGPSVLAVGTEIDEPSSSHRVLELLGLGADMRVRLNLTRPIASGNGDSGQRSDAATRAVAEGCALGQVRIWSSQSSKAAEVRRTLARQMHNAGFESRVLDRSVAEPTYRPPAGGRVLLESFPSRDLDVADLLLALLLQMPVPSGQKKNARRVGAHDERRRQGNSIVSYRYETHRAGTGVLHMRRREVEAGVERPGLVRTFNVAGLRGAARLRIRDVGGRVTAEYAGTRESVAAIEAELLRTMGART